MDHLCAVVIFRINSVTQRLGIVIAHRSGSRHNSKNVQVVDESPMIIIGRPFCSFSTLIIKEKVVHSLKGLSINLFADILPHKPN